MNVPQFIPWIGEEEYKAIKSCFDENWLTEGPKAEAFKRRLLDLINVKYGVFAPNGTLALYLALKSLSIGQGDEVIVPDFTFIGSANAVEMTGARPIFIDVNRDNFQIDVSQVDKIINKNTKAIMPVHIYGSIGNMDVVCEIAKQYNLFVIEDAAQAIGVHYKQRSAGTFGHVNAFSFFADKTITTSEGGFVVTNDKNIYDKLVYLRNQGRKERGTFIHPEIGYNFRMTDIQCAIGLVQLNKLNQIIERKNKVKDLYYELLGGISNVRFYLPEPESEWIPFRVVILCERAHDLMNFMRSQGIEPRTFFYPIHKQPCYAYLRCKDEDFPNAIYAYDQGVCLPTFPTLTDEQIRYVVSTIKEFYG